MAETTLSVRDFGDFNVFIAKARDDSFNFLDNNYVEVQAYLRDRNGKDFTDKAIELTNCRDKVKAALGDGIYSQFLANPVCIRTDQDVMLKSNSK